MTESSRCIAYTEEGVICGQPATRIDEQRGGMVCEEHYRPKQDRVIYVRIPQELDRRLRQDARRQQRSLSAQVRYILLDWYEGQEAEARGD